MMQPDFSTQLDIESLANEVTCLKALVTLILKGMGQADAGKVIINLEKYIAELNNPQQEKVLNNTINQIKQAYRQ